MLSGQQTNHFWVHFIHAYSHRQNFLPASASSSGTLMKLPLAVFAPEAALQKLPLPIAPALDGVGTPLPIAPALDGVGTD